MWSVICLKYSYEAKQPNSQAGLGHALFLPKILVKKCVFEKEGLHA